MRLTHISIFIWHKYSTNILTQCLFLSICLFSDVESWTVEDVGEWLRSISLDQYLSSFISNEISGLILLDLGLDDLDYLGVVILAHRKLILKAVEDLRKYKRVAATATFKVINIICAL